MTDRPLDLAAVQAFVRIAELGSFTRTAEASGTTQSAVSLKLKRLESRLGYRLIERTPRWVTLTGHGAAFLQRARELLEAHDRARTALTGARQRLGVGISDHVSGPGLSEMIARMNARDPELVMEVRIGSSADLLRQFDRRELDTVLVRMDTGRNDGQCLGEEKFGWFAAPGWQHRADEPLPVATLAEPCDVRLMAGRLLDEADIAWREAFVGGGVAAVSAAVMANIGVAALADRMLPLGAIDVSRQLGLPDLPSLPIMLHSSAKHGRARAAVNELAAAFSSMAQR